VEIFDGLGRHHTLKGEAVAQVLGLEGATGIITKLRIKVTKEQVESLNILQVDSAEAAVRSLTQAINDKVIFLEYLDQLSSALLGLPKERHLIIGYVDTSGEIQDDARISEVIEKNAASCRSCSGMKASFLLKKLHWMRNKWRVLSRRVRSAPFLVMAILVLVL
jgi:hypothetical protein